MVSRHPLYFQLTKVEYCQRESGQSVIEVYDCGRLVEQEATVH